jgi:hypothetical protein
MAPQVTFHIARIWLGPKLTKLEKKPGPFTVQALRLKAH